MKKIVTAETVRTTAIILVMACLLVAPDFIFSMFNKTFKHSVDIKVLFLVLPIGCGLILNKYRWFSFFVVSLLLILQFIQFSHIAYFGTPMTHYSIYLAIQEFGEVVVESINSIYRCFYVLPAVLAPFIMMFYFIKTERCKSICGTILLASSLLYFGYNRISLERFMPNEIRFSIDNSLKTLFGCIHMILTEDKVKKYVSYETFDIGKAFDEPTTIVYIIGESVNYRHMSLFGYERDTTPLLKDLAKSDNFYYVMGMAGGVNTLSSLKFMMNAIYEPDNKRQTSSDQTNLFKLAKSRGFKTFYISSQRDNVLASIGGVGYIDVIINNGSNISKVGKISDDQLLDQIKINELGDLNFIVLHQRCMHVPYSDWVEEARFDGNNEDDRIDKYDNAMLKNDRIISKIFGHFNGQKVGKFYIIWTSDHNELLGEDGLYGHGALVKKVAEVPFMIESNDGTFIDDIRGIGRMSHYGLAKAVAKVLGYEIKNPNEVNGMIYVSGADFNGLCGYMIFEGGGDDCKASLCRSSEGALPQSFEKDCGVVPTSLKNVQFKQ